MDGLKDRRSNGNGRNLAESLQDEGYEPTSKLIDDALEALDRHSSDSKNEWTARALIVIGLVIALAQLAATIWPALDPGGMAGTTVQLAFLLFAAFLVILGVFFLTVFSTQGRILRERCIKLESSRMRIVHDEKIAGLGHRGIAPKKVASRDRSSHA